MRTRNRDLISLKSLVLIVAVFFAVPAFATTFTVSNTNDSGAGSLRQAILDLNATGTNGDIIQFTAGAAGTITLASTLPSLNYETIFDTTDYNVTMTSYGGGTDATKWFKFNGAGDGTFTVGSGSSWAIGGGLVVGDAANGSLAITGGGSVSNAYTSYVASGAASFGEVTVNGAGSTWTNSEDVYIGSGNNGFLYIENGGAVSSVNGYIGGYAGGNGLVVIDGAGSTWTNSVDLHIGKADVGEMDIHNGGAVSNVNGYIGTDGGSSGFATVDGGSTWTNSGTLVVGDSGTGNLDILSGGAVSNTTSYVGSHDTGTVTVDGAASTWTNSGNMYIGSGATGTLNVTDGGSASGVNCYIGGYAGGDGTVNVDGAGATLTTSGNIFVGDADTGELDILDGGTVNVAGGAGTVTIAHDVGSTGTLKIGTGVLTAAGTLNAATVTGGDGTATVTFNYNDSSYTFDPVLAGSLSLTYGSAGILNLNSANTYTGGTTINSGTVRAGNATALGAGAVTNNATLDVGLTTLNVAGVYTQAAGSTLKLTADSISSFGSIVSASDAVVSSVSSVNVTVNGYMPNDATITIIDGAGGNNLEVPATITSSNSRYTLLGSSAGGDLILTVNRSGPGQGFAGNATNSNGAAVGAVLDNITSPSGDMLDVLDTLEGMDPVATGDSLNTMTPVVDGAVVTASGTSLNQFISTAIDRLGGLFARSHDSGENGETGVSAGSNGTNGPEAWGRGFGEYVKQKPRGLSNGYRATIWGTAVGGDIPAFREKVRLGLSGGYAQSDINSKDNSGRTDIDSYQGSFYGGYMDAQNPYYLNGAFTFAYNKYKGKRNIAVGPIMRTAHSDYDGQQYSVIFDGGYIIKAGKFRLTPVASLQYMRLHVQSYTETNADALNLSVKSQNYDMLQSGLGGKLERTFETENVAIIPGVHVKWLYDFIGDSQETTSAFAGGGGSFATQGFDPAQNSLNVGANLTLMAKNNWSLETNYDFEYKEDFAAHTGWAEAKYRF